MTDAFGGATMMSVPVVWVTGVFLMVGGGDLGGNVFGGFGTAGGLVPGVVVVLGFIFGFCAWKEDGNKAIESARNISEIVWARGVFIAQIAAGGNQK